MPSHIAADSISLACPAARSSSVNSIRVGLGDVGCEARAAVCAHASHRADWVPGRTIVLAVQTLHWRTASAVWSLAAGAAAAAASAPAAGAAVVDDFLAAFFRRFGGGYSSPVSLRVCCLCCAASSQRRCLPTTRVVPM